MKSKIGRNKYVQLAMGALLGLLMLSLSACGDNAPVNTDPANPSAVTATAATWLNTNPFTGKHDGGWVYSAREDRLYAMYGNDNNGQTLYRIDHINNISTVATTSLFNRHGSQPVIDSTGTYIYMPPSQNTNQLERYNTVTNALETLAPAPTNGTFSHGAWKNGKLWIVLDDNNLYSYDPVANTWSASLHTFTGWGNVAASGPSSNLIYIIVSPAGDFFSYDVTTGTTTTLTSHPTGFVLGGNGEFTWFGNSVGYIYAAESESGGTGTPAIYNIAAGTWHALSDPKISRDYAGHATYDSLRHRLYVVGAGATSDDAWYYQY